MKKELRDLGFKLLNIVKYVNSMMYRFVCLNNAIVEEILTIFASMRILLEIVVVDPLLCEVFNRDILCNLLYKSCFANISISV